MTQRIAIPSNEGMLWPHFGKAPQVTFFSVEDGQIKDSTVLQAPEHQHGAMPRFLAEQHCTDVICGGIGCCLNTPATQKLGLVLDGHHISRLRRVWRLFELSSTQKECGR